jgi:hypothetical protein
VITHQEHTAIQLPPGRYLVGRVTEYDWDAEERRQVVD